MNLPDRIPPTTDPTAPLTSRRLSLRAAATFTMFLTAICVSGSTCGTTIPTGTPTIVDSDHILGSADAPVTVVEYASLACSHCRDFATTQFATVRAQYIDTGKVRWVFRHLISMSNTDLVRAACATECAGDQGQYVEYRDLLFQNLGQFSADSLKQFATNLGLDRTAFDACLDGQGKIPRVQQDVDSGVALGVNATPTFFVDGEMVVGFRTADALGAIIDRHIAEKGDGGPP